MKVAVQGIQGSFSEMAAKHYLKQQAITEYQLVYLLNSHQVLKAVNEQGCELGIFAIENSTGGVVFESIYALAAYRCHINQFFSIPITQNLLVKPGQKLSDITSIHSHHQALSQCKNYLSQQFGLAKLVEETDTAYAAKQLADNAFGSHAAVIGNQNCAELYDLEIIANNINDLEDNQTLFIAASKARSP